MVLQVYDARGSLPSSSSSSILFIFLFCFVARSVVGMGRSVCLFFLSLHLYRDIHPHHPGATITSYLLPHLSTLTSCCSSDTPWCNGCTLSSIPSAWCYGLHGAMWASLGDPASGRKGFASTDSQSYIFLIAVFLFLVFFSYPPRILGRS